MDYPFQLSQVKAVLFDYDGVLVASQSTHFRAWMQLLAELNLPIDLKVAQQLIHDNVGKTAPEIISILLNTCDPQWAEPAHQEKFPLDPKQLAYRKNIFYLEAIQQGLDPYPGVVEGIKSLNSKGIKMAIVSNARKKELHLTLNQIGIAQWIDPVLSREDVPAYKPDPLPYLMAAGFLGLETHECIAVEDSPPGLEAALKANIPVVAVTTNFTKKQLETPVPGRPDLKPFWIVESIEEFFNGMKSYF